MIKQICLASLLALLLAAEASAQAPVIGQGGASPGPPLVFRGNQAYVGGPAPHFGQANETQGCGNSTIADGSGTTAGSVFLGTTYDPTMYCGIRFNTPFVSYPVACNVHAVSNAWDTGTQPTNFRYIGTPSSIIWLGGIPGGLITWVCFGLNLP